MVNYYLWVKAFGLGTGWTQKNYLTEKSHLSAKESDKYLRKSLLNVQLNS
jgi:hypothetical protein